MENLKELRIKKGLTQEEVANMLNVSHATYWGYEIGKYEPNIDTLKKLADLFDISIDTLVGRQRPNDLPSSATPEQKQVIQVVLQLEQINTLRAMAYCSGLLAGQN